MYSPFLYHLPTHPHTHLANIHQKPTKSQALLVQTKTKSSLQQGEGEVANEQLQRKRDAQEEVSNGRTKEKARKNSEVEITKSECRERWNSSQREQHMQRRGGTGPTPQIYICAGKAFPGELWKDETLGGIQGSIWKDLQGRVNCLDSLQMVASHCLRLS